MNVLIVEDHEAMRDLMARFLGDAGHAVRAVASAEEGLEALRREGAEVLVSDLRLPGMDGLALLAEAKALDPDMAVILVTAHGTVEDAVRAMRMGALDFLTKPFPMEELELKVAKAIGMRQLRGKTQALEEEVNTHLAGMVVASPAMRRVCEQAEQAAQSKVTVLLSGESGTGKELVARLIHHSSPHKEGPFVSAHCAALAPGLLESELFGHEKGAFTGALSAKKGRFELAQGGTLFLDEISEVPLDMQVKLLRVLQEREFERVGGTKPVRVDLRVVAATNRDLATMVSQGRFREDLYYRLNVVQLTVPPLRMRREDIEPLARHFTARFCRELGRPLLSISPATLEAFQAHEWPGNVRELQNLVERGVVFARGGELDLKPDTSNRPATMALALGRTLEETMEGLERELVSQALKQSRGVQNQAAKKLGISRSNMQYKVRKHKLEALCHADID